MCFYVYQITCYTKCNYYGSIREDLDFIYGNNPELDIYNEDDREAIIEKISEVLDSYTNEEIVNELYGSSSDNENDYAAITKFMLMKLLLFKNCLMVLVMILFFNE
ncbi:putative orfan [Tupanvirus soda lake]|uniref:Orfan n=2 Tax=Tupanvirus TaxID=2094720 RepID=A0AC62ADC9_9VIRU|nr:putative orfan [Tupanvirus soda lake]QKU35655.1 putative orfan [Tupanvirus soda lake]